MACGTPVVASPNPGSLEVLDDGRAACCRPTTTFAGELAALLGDEARRARAVPARAARVRASSRSRACSASYEELLFELTEVHAGSSRIASERADLRRRRRRWSVARDDGRASRWGWAEVFLAIQLLWGAALFIPGAQAYRTVGARACRTWPARRRSSTTSARRPASRCTSSAKWLIASFGAAVAEPAARDHALDGRRGAGRLPAQHRRAGLLDGARRAHATRARCAWCGCCSRRARSARRSASCRCTTPTRSCRPSSARSGSR